MQIAPKQTTFPHTQRKHRAAAKRSLYIAHAKQRGVRYTDGSTKGYTSVSIGYTVQTTKAAGERRSSVEYADLLFDCHPKEHVRKVKLRTAAQI